MDYTRRFYAAVFTLAVLLVSRGQALTAEKSVARDYVPVTTKDVTVPVGHLALLLKPLTKEELVGEADAWLGLLRAKVKEVSDAELAVKKQTAQINKMEDAASAVEEAHEAVQEADRVLKDAQTKGDEGAIRAAEEAQQEARQKLKEAKKATDEARDTAKKAGEDEDVRKAAERAVEKALQKAKEKADEEAEGGAAPGAVEPPATKKEGEVPVVEVAGAARPDQLKEAAEAARKDADAKSEVKTALLDDVNQLRNERTALIDRLNIVLDELELKGGEVESYSTYIAAVSGISIDVSDTSAAWATVAGWIRSEEGGLRLGRNVLRFLAILFAFYVLALVLGKLTDKATRSYSKVSGLLRDFLLKTVRRATLIVGLVVSVSALGINVGPLLAVIGAAGFVVGFALQGTLSNFASGLLILMYRPFDVGDVVEVAGISGKVESTNLVSTHVKTFDNKAVIIPNNDVWGGIITNATGTKIRRVDLVFGIGYGDDIAKAQGILEEIVANHELVLKDPESVVKLHELADSSVNFVCRPWVKTADYWTVYWDVTRSVKEEFDRQGVSIPFPQRDVHVIQETPQSE